jgi:UTP--glucose-1-phosphate uridylyltransferase
MFNLYAHNRSEDRSGYLLIVLVNSVFQQSQLKGFHSLYPTFKDARACSMLACRLTPCRDFNLSTAPPRSVPLQPQSQRRFRIHPHEKNARKNVCRAAISTFHLVNVGGVLSEDVGMKPIRKAVIPVAGLGTRFLPATKAQPKEMLPLVDKPVIQHVVEEAIRAGIECIVLVTGRGKQAIENHFDVAYELEDTLIRRGKQEDLAQVQGITNLAQFAYVRQGEPLGLGHAVLCAQHTVGDEPFALLLGDDVFDVEDPALDALIAAHNATGKSIVGVQQVPMDHVHRYGIVNSQKSNTPWWNVTSIVEKPQPKDAPSNWAVVGRYILTARVFEHLRNLQPGVGGEYQLTDALALLAAEGQLCAAPIPAKRFDTGNKLDYLKANVEFALKRDDLASDFLQYLRDIVAQRS